MKKYKIYKENVDFIVDEDVKNLTGSRTKKMAFMIKTKEKVILKYNKYESCTELASEKIAYEIAKKIGFKCARIELAEDRNGLPAILNYYFLKEGNDHNDALFYLKDFGNNRKEYYTLDKIINFLKNESANMIDDFLKIMVFDSLIGEQDRHEENWGITKDVKENKQISPIYDNGCCLMRDQYMNLDEFLNNSFKMDQYINKSVTYIYDNNGKRYKHFDLIDILLKIYPEKLKLIINNINILTDEAISKIVQTIPEKYLSEKHKKCVILFIQKRREILLNKLMEV